MAMCRTYAIRLIAGNDDDDENDDVDGDEDIKILQCLPQTSIVMASIVMNMISAYKTVELMADASSHPMPRCFGFFTSCFRQNSFLQ